MSKNLDHKGRRSEPRHIRLYHSVTGCDAWLDLSGNAVKLLVALMRLDKGGDNGKLFLSVRNAADMLGVHRNTAVRLFRELETHGFIAATERGHFKVKGGPATSWRLTWLPAPARSPTRDFERWQPESGNKSRSQKNSTAVTKIVTPAGNNAQPVTKNVTAALETPLVSVDARCTKTVTQVVCHGHIDSGGDRQSRKQGNSSDGPRSADLSVEFLDALRRQALAVIEAAPVGAQSRIADQAGIPGGTLSKFLHDGRGLSQHHFVNLQLELRRRDLDERDAA